MASLAVVQSESLLRCEYRSAPQVPSSPETDHGSMDSESDFENGTSDQLHHNQALSYSSSTKEQSGSVSEYSASHIRDMHNRDGAIELLLRNPAANIGRRAVP